MELKIRKIGHSHCVIIPKKELKNRNLSEGDLVEISISNSSDPFWDFTKSLSVDEYKSSLKEDNLLDDDMAEWKKL